MRPRKLLETLITGLDWVLCTKCIPQYKVKASHFPSVSTMTPKIICFGLIATSLKTRLLQEVQEELVLPQQVTQPTLNRVLPMHMLRFQTSNLAKLDLRSLGLQFHLLLDQNHQVQYLQDAQEVVLKLALTCAQQTHLLSGKSASKFVVKNVLHQLKNLPISCNEVINISTEIN